MKRYIVFLDTGYVGMGACEALTMPDDHTEEELSRVVWEMAVEHASDYGVEASNVFDPEASDDFDSGDEYSCENIEGSAELYDPEKHDMLRTGGGSFLEDFEDIE